MLFKIYRKLRTKHEVSMKLLNTIDPLRYEVSVHYVYVDFITNLIDKIATTVTRFFNKFKSILEDSHEDSIDFANLDEIMTDLNQKFEHLK